MLSSIGLSFLLQIVALFNFFKDMRLKRNVSQSSDLITHCNNLRARTMTLLFVCFAASYQRNIIKRLEHFTKEQHVRKNSLSDINKYNIAQLLELEQSCDLTKMQLLIEFQVIFTGKIG